jgi:hypothetical protein
MLRAARAADGRYFPGTFTFSPLNGDRLVSPQSPLPLSLAVDGQPKLALPSQVYFSHEFEGVELPAPEVAYAGDAAISLLCNLAEGATWRWSPNGWIANGALPASGGSRSRQPPAATPFGFAYASDDVAVAVIAPGPDEWQSIQTTPRNVFPITHAVRHGEGAALLCRVGEQLGQLSWSRDDGWRLSLVEGDAPDVRRDFASLVSGYGTIGGLIGLCEGNLFQITPDFRCVQRDWPAGFTPMSDFAPARLGNAIYFLGYGPNSVPAWTCVTRELVTGSMLQVDAAATPCEGGFVTSTGFTDSPGGNSIGRLRLPSGMVGKPLLYFDDAILFLGIEARELWADALANKPRRWKTRLMLSRMDGSVVELSEERRLDQTREVGAVVTGEGLIVIGFGRNRLWRNGSERT